MESTYHDLYERARHKSQSLPAEEQRLFLEYIQYIIHRQYSPSTVLQRIYLLLKFRTYLVDTHQSTFFELRKEHLHHYIDQKLEQGHKAKSINGYLGSLRAFYGYLLDEEEIAKNPILTRYFLKEDKRLPRPMTSEDLAHCLKHLPDNVYKILFLLMLHCGLRVSEACKLSKKDINWRQRKLLVHNGKGKVDRMVYFSEELEILLEDWIEITQPVDYLFPYKDHRCIPTVWVNQWMREWTRELGLGEQNYTPHRLRHTFATEMLNAGMPLHVLKELLGHKSVDQTLMYAQLSDQTIRASYYRAFEVENPHPSSIQPGARYE